MYVKQTIKYCKIRVWQTKDQPRFQNCHEGRAPERRESLTLSWTPCSSAASPGYAQNIGCKRISKYAPLNLKPGKNIPWTCSLVQLGRPQRIRWLRRIESEPIDQILHATQHQPPKPPHSPTSPICRLPKIVSPTRASGDQVVKAHWTLCFVSLSCMVAPLILQTGPEDK